MRDRHLLPDRRRVGELVVFGDHDERQLLDGGKVHRFVEHAGARRAVADVHHRDQRTLLHLRRERDAAHHGDHVAERADRVR